MIWNLKTRHNLKVNLHKPITDTGGFISEINDDDDGKHLRGTGKFFPFLRFGSFLSVLLLFVHVNLSN